MSAWRFSFEISLISVFCQDIEISVCISFCIKYKLYQQPNSTYGRVWSPNGWGAAAQDGTSPGASPCTFHSQLDLQAVSSRQGAVAGAEAGAVDEGAHGAGSRRGAVWRGRCQGGHLLVCNMHRMVHRYKGFISNQAHICYYIFQHVSNFCSFLYFGG